MFFSPHPFDADLPVQRSSTDALRLQGGQAQQAKLPQKAPNPNRFQAPLQEDNLVFCDPERGTRYSADTVRKALTAALAAATVDTRRDPSTTYGTTAITNGAAAGSSPIAVMAKAGHRSMATTNRYLHLAGVVFRDESTEPSTYLTAPEPISQHLGVAQKAQVASS